MLNIIKKKLSKSFDRNKRSIQPKLLDAALYEDSVAEGLFDPLWYQHQYKLFFDTPEAAFNDYLRKSKFSNVAPSMNFDPVSYFHNNPDVYAVSESPLLHYLRFGRYEGRQAYPLRPLWNSSDNINVSEYKHKREGRYAVVLHIFYEDFIKKFHNAFMGVDFEFDLFITTTSKAVEKKAKLVFENNPAIKNINVTNVPNKGRNFGGFLVEYSKDLLEYDFVCHLHSKKSLYSGSEQVHWAEYLLEYLARDKQILSKMLNIFEQDEKLGLFYPTTFWNMPQWTCHWLKNKGIGNKTLKEWFDLKQDKDFFSYPAGGMFWAKKDALKPILERSWSYDDFPEEPIPADGTILHVIERILPIVAENEGFKSFYYYPPTGEFTIDESFIFLEYQFGLDYRMNMLCSQQEICSFDIFDTLVWRKFYEPDYAKYLLPERAELSITGEEFVELRNNAELDVRKKKHFKGDVSIHEVYVELANNKVINASDVDKLSDLEFEIDLSMISPKEVMVSFLNSLSEQGKEIYIVSDTYYSKAQIEKLLSVVGVKAPYKLYVSSDMQMRKDNGSIWEHLSKGLKSQNKIDKFVHIGDNVVSDSQIPGDFDLRTLHILAPKDKWQAQSLCEIPSEAFGIKNISEMKRWGLLLSKQCVNPFL
ncbi:hypothetical protein NBRC116188_18550 [Oceaniserpentilla sp. 4NH20-0058]|uniref:rhamnan synthesis F family protein n=1 Tax=Oceaniserpentilla sp. 4NH20-0058 TaxID=3127660 RepID=UPI00310486F4